MIWVLWFCDPWPSCVNRFLRTTERKIPTIQCVLSAFYRFAQSTNCEQFCRISTLSCHTSKAQSEDCARFCRCQICRAQNVDRARFCPTQLGAHCANPLNVLNRWTSVDSQQKSRTSFLAENLSYLTQSYLHINQQHLLRTSCEFKVYFRGLWRIFEHFFVTRWFFGWIESGKLNIFRGLNSCTFNLAYFARMKT